MNMWYTLFLLVALWSGTQSANAASTISKRQADPVDSQSPDSVTDSPVTEPVDPPRDQLSPSSIITEAQRNESSKSEAKMSLEELKSKWSELLTNSANHVKAAFERYDRANETKSVDLVQLGNELRLRKFVLDAAYYIYQQEITEYQRNSTDSTGSEDSTNLKGSTSSKGSANLKDSTNSKNSVC